MRALDTLRNLTQNQAECIKTLAPYILGPGILCDWLINGGIRPDLKDMGIDPHSVVDGSLENRKKAHLALLDLMSEGFVGDNRNPLTYNYECIAGSTIIIDLANAHIAASTNKKRSFLFRFIHMRTDILELISIDRNIVPDKIMVSHIISELRYRGFSVKAKYEGYVDDKAKFDPRKYRQIFFPMH